MRNYPFEKNFPSISYIANNWPRTKDVLKKFILSNHKLPDLYNLCLNCLSDLNVHKIDKMKPILKKLSTLCSKNVTYNTYHDSHHFKSVIIIACLLAKLSNLKNYEDKFLLIIIALTHDLGHLGRRIQNRSFYQEEKSFSELSRNLFRAKPNFKKNQRIKKIFRSTYFPIKPEKVDDHVQKIILDADILASLMFGLDVGVEFASRLKHELRFEGGSKQLFSGFLKFLDNKSLYLDSSKKSC
jgi:hypothetical protein